MRKTKQALALFGMIALVLWAAISRVNADTASQKASLEATLTAVVTPGGPIDQTAIQLQVSTRVPGVLTPGPGAAQLYDAQYGQNFVLRSQAICVNAYVQGYATPGSPTVVVPTPMPTRTPGP